MSDSCCGPAKDIRGDYLAAVCLLTVSVGVGLEASPGSGFTRLGRLTASL
jgi:hypothetical protein